MKSQSAKAPQRLLSGSGIRPLRFGRRFVAAVWPRWHIGGAAFERPHAARTAIGFFAPGLIAAKPVKPCDGGIFEALNLLLFLKQRPAVMPLPARQQGVIPEEIRYNFALYCRALQGRTGD